MLRKWYCQLDFTLTINPIDPILVKSGTAQVTGADMFPVAMKDANGGDQYYLPGTSLKGVFRSHLERVGRTLNPASVCVPYYDPIRTDRSSIPVEDQQRNFGCSYLLSSQTQKPTVYRLACPACRIFGLLGFAGRFHVSDALAASNNKPRKEQRDGVGIDRFTGGSARGVLFNQEVLVGGQYVAQVRLTNFELWQLSALTVLLMDLKDGMLQVGSGKSRSLGRVQAEASDISLTYLRNPSQDPGHSVLRGLYQLESDEARKAYGFLGWQLEQSIELGVRRARGLRDVFDVDSTAWESWSDRLVPGFAASLDGHAKSKEVIALREAAANPQAAG